MLDKLLALLERFVVAHELIAAAPHGKEETPEKGDGAAGSSAPKRGRKPAAKKEPEPEDEPKRGRKAAADDVDYKAMREEIADIDDALNDGDSNEAVDEFDDLMGEYGAKKLKDLQDEDLEAFLKAAKKIVNKYYEEE